MADMFEITQGDLAPGLEIDLAELGTALPIPDTAVVTLRWTKPDGSIVSGVVLTVVDAATGAVVKFWDAGDTDVVGIHRAQVVVTDTNALPMTYPSDGTHARWIVWPKIA